MRLLLLPLFFILGSPLLFAKEKPQSLPPPSPAASPLQAAGVAALQNFLPQILQEKVQLGFAPEDDLDQLVLGTPLPVAILLPQKIAAGYDKIFQPTQDYWFPIKINQQIKAIITLTTEPNGSLIPQSFGYTAFAQGLQPILDAHQNSHPLTVILCNDPVGAFLRIDGLKYPSLMPIPTNAALGKEFAQKPPPAELVLKNLPKTPLDPDLQPFPSR